MQKTVIAIGRFQPVHIGHMKMIEQLKNLAVRLDAIPMIIIIHSGKEIESLPLTILETYKAVESAFPDMKLYVAQNPFVAVSRLYKNYGAVPVGGVTGSDRADTYKGLIGRALGQEFADNYHTEILQRDQNSKYTGTPLHTSGTFVRQLVKEGNFEDFQKLIPLSDSDTKDLYILLRQRICNVDFETKY